jgi:hypothetical protein
MDQNGSSGLPEQVLSGQPAETAPVPPVPEGRRIGREQAPYVAVIVGAVAVAIGSLMSWDSVVLGPVAFSEKSGIRGGSSLWVLLLAALLLARNVALLRAASSSPRARAAPLVTSGVILFIAIRFAVSLKEDFTTWLFSTGVAEAARAAGVSQTNIEATFRTWVNSGQLHLTLSLGFWLVVGGALVSAGAAVADLIVNRAQAPSVGWALLPV